MEELFWMTSEHYNADEPELLMDVFNEIDNGSDRAAVIIAAAFVEDHLASAIKSRLHPDEKLFNETFRSTGPLGSFSAKISFAFLIGLCSKEACKDLNTIKEIRNEFAHRVLTKDFNSQRVRDLANNLSFFERMEVKITPVDGSHPPISLITEEPTTPRARYVQTCRHLLMGLTIAKRSPPTLLEPEF